MNTAMYDAREAMGPGGSYGSANRGTNTSLGGNQATQNVQNFRDKDDGRGFRHDPLTYIGPDRSTNGQGYGNLPIPVGIFMNMAHVPPRFYNQHQQMIAQGEKGKKPPPTTTAGRRVPGRGRVKGDSQLSQGGSQEASQGYSQGPLTQGGGMSQPGLSLSQPGMSQTELSQDSLMAGDFHSQMDGLLSQDSTYQGDRFASQHQYLSQLSQQ